MRIDLGQFVPRPAVSRQVSTIGDNFGDTVKKAITEVNDIQKDADKMATNLASGDAVEVHQAMVAMQKASTALQFTIQVRNKIVEAYQEVMRTQV